MLKGLRRGGAGVGAYHRRRRHGVPESPPSISMQCINGFKGLGNWSGIKEQQVNDLGKQLSGKDEKTFGDAKEAVKDANKYS